MIRRPPRSTQSRSSAASDVYKRQVTHSGKGRPNRSGFAPRVSSGAVSYTHLRAHETRHDLVCRLLLEKKKLHSDLKEIQDSELKYLNTYDKHTFSPDFLS